MKITMADGKEATTVDTPNCIVSTPERDESPKKGKITRKHILIGVSVVVVVALVLVAILVGMYMFTEAQKEIVKFSLQFKGSDNENIDQDVESDPNDNVVMTTVKKGDQTAYIVNDFNRGIQTVKLVTKEGTNCYVNSLNKSLAMDPTHITGSDSMTGTGGNAEETFVISEDPVSDRSFLAKKAQDVCKGISLYWVSRVCGKQVPDNFTGGERAKRAIYRMSPYYGLPGLGGCCKAYWACGVTMYESIQGILHTCTTYVQTRTCCGSVPYPYCYNYYYAYWRTPGLNC